MEGIGGSALDTAECSIPFQCTRDGIGGSALDPAECPILFQCTCDGMEGIRGSALSHHIP